MKGRTSLGIISTFLVTAVLVLTSCAVETPTTPTIPTAPITPTTPATPTTPTTPAKAGPEMVKIKATKGDGTVVEKMVEKPKYGGLFVEARSVDPTTFDEADSQQGLSHSMFFTNEELSTGDWTKGPAGTGEASWLFVSMPFLNQITGCLAESWDISMPDTFVFHIRKGIHWHNKPPVNGREMNANDVAFSLKRLFLESPTCYNQVSYGSYIESITTPDKWTVVVKVKPGFIEVVFGFMVQHSMITPPEIVQTYGSMRDWRNSCGTGPFMLVDYVKESSLTFVRNPNYWGKDPFFPENQLPYLDGVKLLTIPDLSTRIAALRTAKVDWLPGVEWEDAGSLTKTSPELKYFRYLRGCGYEVHFRVDKPETPFYD